MRGARVLALAASLFVAASTLVSASEQQQQPSGGHLDLSAVKNIFAFGDSYSQDGYDPARGLLADDDYGDTTTGGHTWLRYMSWTMDERFGGDKRRLHNLARSGAPVNKTIVPLHDAVDFEGQVDMFKRYFVEHGGETTQDEDLSDWTADDSLFVIYFGVNDVGLSLFWGMPVIEMMGDIFKSYAGLFSRLHKLGARKFLILTCPPTERTPNVIYSENLSTSLFLEAIKAWNAHLHVFVQTIPTLHPDASVRLYDSDQFFNYALDHHAALGFPEENTYYCPSYIEIRGQPELHLPECRQALKHTFWLNSYHPTWPVHKYMSLDIVAALSSDKKNKAVAHVYDPQDPSTYTTELQGVSRRRRHRRR